MAGGNPARLAAPLALLAAAGAVVIVVAASRSGSSPRPPSATPTAVTRTTGHAKPRPRVYVVKAGDTLTLIAQRTGVALETIQRLNPQVDPQALQTGQRLKLAP